MSFFRAMAAAALAFAIPAHAAIESPEQAVDAAKRWMKARCTDKAPCRFRAERQGKEWRVWVHPGKAKDPTRVILFFDREGNLIRRIDGE